MAVRTIGFGRYEMKKMESLSPYLLAPMATIAFLMGPSSLGAGTKKNPTYIGSLMGTSSLGTGTKKKT